MKFSLDPSKVRSSMASAKIVKPVMGDYSICMSNEHLKIWSFDRRRSIVCFLPLPSPVDAEEEFYLPDDRAALFDSELDNLSVTINDKGMSLKFEGGGKSRTATIKKRAPGSRRPKIPPPPSSDSFTKVKSSDLDNLLRQVSCSALVKETKTEEDMRVNQVHLYGESGHAFSTARFYATVAHMDGLTANVSIVSSDIPTIRAFLSKMKGDVLIGCDAKCMYIVDPVSGSWMSTARVASDKPTLSVPPEGEFDSVVEVQREDFHKSIKWCSMALEGTPRLSLSVSNGILQMNSGSSELASIPATVSGVGFTEDFPVKVLMTISDHLEDGLVKLMYGSRAMKGVMEITQGGAPVSSRHFVRCMKGKLWTNP